MRVEVKEAAKRYGKVEALRGVSLEIPAGRRVALVGPNGSGKSTLLRAMLGLIDCEGTVLLDGRSPYDDRVELARRLAYVPQVAPALGATVKEVIDLVTLTRGLPRGAIAEVAKKLSLDVEAIRARPFRNLSGGMKQKLLLATAFAARPALLVLDEPTASLDAGTRERFFELCEALAPQTTVLLCSHRIEELRQLAQHVVALEDGRITFEGTAEEYLSGTPVTPSPSRGQRAASSSPLGVPELAFAHAERDVEDSRE
jgi:ABC-2 type transport system ATP-binding protein